MAQLHQRVHPSGPEADYAARVTVFDRAMAAVIDDVGLGALFGLYDLRFEVLALGGKHSKEQDGNHGWGDGHGECPRRNHSVPDSHRHSSYMH